MLIFWLFIKQGEIALSKKKRKKKQNKKKKQQKKKQHTRFSLFQSSKYNLVICEH